MKNLEQIRAKNALAAAQKYRFSGKEDGQVVKKVPTMIRENGLLGALSFAVERNDKGHLKNLGHYDIWQAIVDHLATMPQLMPHASAGHESPATPDAFVNEMVASDAALLRAVTSETMAYLNYLRRFAKKGE
jgi:CRISPR type III-B/RAMP module-associated protein Cmr5